MPEERAKGPEVLNALLDYEGIRRGKPLRNRSDADSASIRLFRFILHPQDPRWRIARHYELMRQEEKISRIHLEIGLLASYLAPYSSYRNAYSSYIGKANIRQLARAVKNNEVGQGIMSRYGRAHNLNGGYEIHFVKTSNATMKRDADGVTGCPEALWQLQLRKDGQYIGRIGFNFHREQTRTAVSITNIQGADGAKKELTAAESALGNPFYKILIDELKTLVPENALLRGIAGQTGNQPLYTMAFRKSKITRVMSGREKDRLMNRHNPICDT